MSKKGFFTVDGLVAMSILILAFVTLINEIHLSFDVLDLYGPYAQILGSVVGTGTLLNSLYALDPSSGKDKSFTIANILPSYKMKLANESTGSSYHVKDIQITCYSTNSSKCVLQSFYSQTINGHKFVRAYSYPTFVTAVFGTNVTLDSSEGGYVRSNKRPENVSFTSCDAVLAKINASGFYYGKAHLYWGNNPWFCDPSCQGPDNYCDYSCSGLTECNNTCVSYGLLPPPSPTSGPYHFLSCKLLGPYYNESNILNDTCGGFPPDPQCGDAPNSTLYEVFWVTYNFTLSSLPGTELYVNAISRNGVVVYVNGRAISCTASGSYSEVHLRIRKYLKVGQNTITIMFLRTDSVCGPCVYDRPAYGVSGSWSISCGSSYLDPGYYGWMGCRNSLTLNCEGSEFAV